jgi:ribose transport system permease protein
MGKIIQLMTYSFQKILSRFGSLLIVYVTLGVLLGLGGLLKPHLLSLGSLVSICRWSSILGLAAIGQTLVMISGGIDISVGAVVFLVSILASALMKGQDTLALPISLACLGIGVLCGLINGIGVNLLKIPPVVMTLSLSLILNGIVWIYTGGVTYGGPAPSLVKFAGKVILGVFPLPFVVWLVIALFFIGVMRLTILGRLFHAIGNNPVAAHYSGVNVPIASIVGYALCGLFSAATGLSLLGYLNMATLRFSDIYTMGSIAAAVIGGTSFFTGLGTISGTICGTIIMRVIFNLLLMFQIPEAGRMVANGLIILVVVALYSLRRR